LGIVIDENILKWTQRVMIAAKANYILQRNFVKFAPTVKSHCYMQYGLVSTPQTKHLREYLQTAADCGTLNVIVTISSDLFNVML